MNKEISWLEKYKLALKENLSVKEIMLLRSVGQPRALEIRSKVIEYCIKNNIGIESQRVPCDVVLLVTEKDISYYYDKMMLEAEALKLEQTLCSA